MAFLYLDEDVSHRLGSLLEIAGHMIYTTHQQGRVESSDGDQLLDAATNGWTIISHNRRDFVLLHDAWLRWTGGWNLSHRHPGILVLSQLPPVHDNAAVIDTLLSTHPSLENILLGHDIATDSLGSYDIITRAYQPYP